MPRRASKLASAGVLALIGAGCGHAAPLPADHPADARAPIGRLAAPPPSLTPGVVSYAAPAGDPQPPAPAGHMGHEGHAMPPRPVTPTGHAGHGANPTEPAKLTGPAKPADAAPEHHHP